MAGERVMDLYEKLQKVDEGTYGKVYRARERTTGKIVALKKIRLPEDDEGVPSTTLSVVSLLRALGTDTLLVRLMDLKQGKNRHGQTILYLVFEFTDTDLRKYITSMRNHGTPIPLPTVKSLMYQLCLGVSLLHGRGVMHRDLKPHNLLLDVRNMRLKIADLGLSRSFTRTHETLTLRYRAPEILLGATHYAPPMDIWSVGCIFAELVAGEAIFTGDSELQHLLRIFKLLGTPTEEIWPGVTSLPNWHEYPRWNRQSMALAVPRLEASGQDLLAMMLMYDPALRISANRALEHGYFYDLDKSDL